MNLPSVKTIETRLGLSRAQATQVRRIMERCNPWGHESVHRAMARLDAILGTYGVEYIADGGDSYITAYGVHYCDTGDAYGMTICQDATTSRFHVCAWADLIESLERRGRSFA